MRTAPNAERSPLFSFIFVLALVFGCGGSNGRSSLVHEGWIDSGNDVEDAGPADSRADDDGPRDVDVDNDAPPAEGAVERADLFWSAFAIDGEWIEYHPTLAEMAASADLLALTSVTELQIREIRGRTPDDVYYEGRLTLKFDEVLRGGSNTSSATLALVAAYTLRTDDAVTLNSLLPLKDVLVFLRERENEAGVYNLVNGYGLWTQTGRADVDCPIVPDLVGGICLYRNELSGVGTVHDLMEQLQN